MASTQGRLSDNEVAAEMTKMVSFIKQEALEKAREIKVKADEEFNIEKAKLVRQETVAIEAFYQKKLKQAEVARKIAQSNHINKSRLRVLQSRQQALNEVFQDARAQLVSISQDKTKYQALLTNLLLQSFYQLMEPSVSVQAKRSEADLVKAAAAAAAEKFKAKIGTPLTFALDQANPLPESSAGGVVVSGKEGRIRVDNTLENRLNLLTDI
ncbi:V-ATPase V1 sector subunit E, partial [Cladochytrium tenue]